MKEEIKQLQDDWAEMRKAADDLLAEARKMRKAFTWGSWEPHYTRVPRRINGRWYWRTTVYRRQRFGPGRTHYQYGDQFDVLRDA